LQKSSWVRFPARHFKPTSAHMAGIHVDDEAGGATSPKRSRLGFEASLVKGN